MTQSSARPLAARHLPRTIAALLGFLALAGCIQSKSPILTDAKPLLGENVRFQHYDAREGAAHSPDNSEFHWDGARYIGTAGSSKETVAFNVFALDERNFIIQNAPMKKDFRIDYALAHKLAEGVYLTFLIEEGDADEATRAKYCVTIDQGTCTVGGLDGLMAFARATAAKAHDTGGLAIRLADDK
jgi:hypothetical protein